MLDIGAVEIDADAKWNARLEENGDEAEPAALSLGLSLAATVGYLAAMPRKPTDRAASAAAELILRFRIERMAKWVGRISPVLVGLVIILAVSIWHRP